MDNSDSNNKVKVKKQKLFNRLLTLAAIAFLVVTIFVLRYNPSQDMFLDNTSHIDLFPIMNSTEYSDNNTESPQSSVTINIAVVGDIMCHNTQYQDAYNSSTDSYDFSHVFTDIKEQLKSADLTIGNLETTFAGKELEYSGYPKFNTPEVLAKNLKDLGFDVLSTANNHSLDKNYTGIINTIVQLDEVGISHTGTYSSEENSNEVLIKDVNGIKIAFLSYTYGTNGISIPKGKEYCINLIDKDKIKSDIQKARFSGADLVSVSMHWGDEYRLQPTEEQTELADFLFENGADLILGSHPHVLEPMEKRTIKLDDGTTKDVFLIYSLGNFVSAQVKEYTNHSIILNLTITKHDEGNITIDTVEYTPIYVDDRGSSAKERFKILDIKKSIEAYENGDTNISKTLYNKLTKALIATDKILAGDI